MVHERRRGSGWAAIITSFPGQPLDRAVDRRLCSRVGGEVIVQQQDGRFGQDGPGQRQRWRWPSEKNLPPSLTAEPSRRATRREIVGTGQPGRAGDFAAGGVRLGKVDVAMHRRIQEHGLLQHGTDTCAREAGSTGGCRGRRWPPPVLGWEKPSSSLSKVLLPAPLRPTKATHCPWAGPGSRRGCRGCPGCS